MPLRRTGVGCMIPKIATGLILAGLVFVFFTVPFMGIDLLMDPVGFVFIFNGARALARLAQAAAGPGGGKTAFGPAWVLALVLLALSLPQIFVAGGPAATVLGIARIVLQAALCLLLAAGFYRRLRITPTKQ